MPLVLDHINSHHLNTKICYKLSGLLTIYVKQTNKETELYFGVSGGSVKERCFAVFLSYLVHDLLFTNRLQPLHWSDSSNKP